jgi:ABC-type multidrug transport system fused ATPase/permease subunit
MFVQTFSEPFIYNDNDIDDLGEKYELRENYINDILANIRLVKSFGTEKKELKRISNIVDKIRESGFWKKVFQEIYSQLYSINDLLIFYECGRKTISGKMDYGELLIFERYSSEFKSSFICLKEVFNSIKDGINSWIKFLEIYDIEQKIVSRKDIIPKTEEDSDKDKKEAKGIGIDFKNVTFSYPTKKNINIINGLDLKVEPGKTVAIVGSSGSGKTTLTNLLLRFYDVNEGEILINGIDIKDINLSWLRANIGIVSQEPVLTSGTIRENILYGVDNYTEKKFIEVCKLSNVYSFATDKKLFPKEFDTIVGERGIKVSGGQKQRIAIARALMKNAKILIFDEATSALDSENEALVQEAINNVISQKKITTIIIAHRLSTVKNANVIYVMNYGKIVEFGTHDELIEKNGEYKKLIYRQLVSADPQK